MVSWSKKRKAWAQAEIEGRLIRQVRQAVEGSRFKEIPIEKLEVFLKERGRMVICRAPAGDVLLTRWVNTRPSNPTMSTEVAELLGIDNKPIYDTIYYVLLGAGSFPMGTWEFEDLGQAWEFLVGPNNKELVTTRPKCVGIHTWL